MGALTMENDDVPKNTALAPANVRTADALARQHTERAITVLASVMEDAEKDADRVHAAKEILDRGWGKPLTATITLPASRKLAAQLYAMEEDELLTAIRSGQTRFAVGAEDAVLATSEDFDFDSALATLPSIYDGVQPSAESVDEDPLLK
jgi:hypothetical protein